MVYQINAEALHCRDDFLKRMILPHQQNCLLCQDALSELHAELGKSDVGYSLELKAEDIPLQPATNLYGKISTYEKGRFYTLEEMACVSACEEIGRLFRNYFDTLK